MQTSCVVGIVNNIYGTPYETVRRWTPIPLSQILRTSFAESHCSGRQFLQPSDSNHGFK